MPKLLWDVFCRVIDNHGDLGVCWRLARDLANRGQRVRLWVDDASALQWMAPGDRPGVTVLPWRAPQGDEAPGDVVIEAFGCDPPEPFVQAMRQRGDCVWINLEYLSAEDYVARSHGLPSPQHTGPGAGLTKWFYYPGFTPATGGLLREPDLPARQAAFDPLAFLAKLGVPRSDAPRVSVFAYPDSPVDGLLTLLGSRGAQVLACPGPVQQALLERVVHHPSVTVTPLPWLTQPDYDRLLWSCDLNLVRGEDSFVRAQWAGQPFVWQIYAQDDGAHAGKLDAFLQRHGSGTEPGLQRDLAALWRAWNRLGPWPASLPDLPAWHEHATRWRKTLLAHGDLATRLQAFVATKR